MYKLRKIILVLAISSCIIQFSRGSPESCHRCEHEHDCKPPHCFCCGDSMPLTHLETPQMVFFTFDDAVHTYIARFYRQLFDSNRKNPNGCPISMTLFVSHANTVYSLVREFYRKGFEIASHSVTHSHPSLKTFSYEARKQKENLSRMAKIPLSQIKGWRSPFLEPLGDVQPSTLKSLGYTYDATLTVSKRFRKDKGPRPFTLDFGWPYDCKIKPCPEASHSGFWEIPVVSMTDYLGKYECVYVDGCSNAPPDEEAAFRFLWDNFYTYYKTNRVPFGINMHAAWFYIPERLRAMDRFIQELVKLDDVYIVSAKQVIAWLQNPTPLNELHQFQPWSCTNAKIKENKSSNSYIPKRTFFNKPEKQVPPPKLPHINLYTALLKPKKTINSYQELKVPPPKLPPINLYTTMLKPNKTINSYQELKSTPPKLPPINLYTTMLKPKKRDHSYKKVQVPPPKLPPINLYSTMLKPKKNLNQYERIKDVKVKNPLVLWLSPALTWQTMLGSDSEFKKQNKYSRWLVGDWWKQKTPKYNIGSTKIINKTSSAYSTTKQQRLKNLSTVKDQMSYMRQNKHTFNRNDTQHQVSSGIVIKNEQRSGVYGEQPHKQESRLYIKRNRKLKSERYRHHVNKEIDGKSKNKQKPSIYMYKKRQNMKNTSNVFDNRQRKYTFNTYKNKKQNSIPKNRKKIILFDEKSLMHEERESAKKRRYHAGKNMRAKQKKKHTNKSVAKLQRLVRQQRGGKLLLNFSTNTKNGSRSKRLRYRKQKIGKQMSLKNRHNLRNILRKFRRMMHEDRNNAKQNKSSRHKLKGYSVIENSVNGGNIPPSVSKQRPWFEETHEKKVTKTLRVPNVQLLREWINLKTASTVNKRKQNVSTMINICTQQKNCFYPNCFCKRTKNPNSIPLSETPQIVYITVDGDLNFMSYAKIKSLFRSSRQNPNKCRIRATFFVSGVDTSYRLVNILSTDEFEIGLNGMQKRGYSKPEIMMRDMFTLGKLLNKYSSIPLEKIQGWRSPNFKLLGDAQFDILKNTSLYDSSAVFRHRSGLNKLKLWPYTLDFGLQEPCDFGHCPNFQHPGVWEVPVIPLVHTKSNTSCIYADECMSTLSSQQTFHFLKDNFDSYYRSYKAPFGIHLSHKWFSWYNSQSFLGFSKFIDAILQNKDVYISSVSNMLQWLQKPTPLSKIQYFDRWKC